MKQKSKKACIAIVGHGVVGSATVAIIVDQYKRIEERSGVNINIKYIVVRNIPEIPKLQTLFTKDLQAVLRDPEVDCIVELVGGIDAALHIVEEALKHGKDIVTANKALLAYKGKHLWGLARAHGRVIAFEASCGGGIPIISALTDGLLANTIDAIFGIVNGTCNYILSNMAAKHLSYADALKESQTAGIAELDPTLDVSGLDTGHKIAIMSSLAFGLQVDFDAIHIQGIENVDRIDISYAKTLGYEIKLLAAAQRLREGVCIWVRPAFIDQKHPLAWVHDSFNAISVYSSINGHSLYYGRGAGGTPTASAVIADIIAVALGKTQITFNHTGYWQDVNTWTNQLAVQKTRNRYYLRVPVWDRAGVLAVLANILADHKISISSILQDEVPETELKQGEQSTNIIIITHMTSEDQIMHAIRSINALDFVHRDSTCIIIAEEHKESIIDHSLGSTN